MTEHYRDMFAPELDYGDAPMGIEDVQLIGNWAFRIGVERNAPAEFKKRVVAAAVSYNLGYAGVDYLLKLYGDGWIVPDPGKDTAGLIYQMTSSVKTSVRAASERVRLISAELDHNGRFLARAALLRLQLTFRASVLTIHNGFHYESAALTRIILEQLAWINTIHLLPDQSALSVKPTKCLAELKKMHPHVGRLYGVLCTLTHMDPETLGDYVNKVDSSLVKPDQLPELLAVDALRLLLVGDVYVCLTEIVFAEDLGSFIHTCRNEKESRLPSPDRPLLGTIQRYADQAGIAVEWR